MVFPTTALPLFQKTKVPKSEAQLSCEANGGRWDEATKTCILQKPEPKPIPTPPVAPPGALPRPETFTDPKTGRASGITLPDGRTFLGLGPEDVEQVAQGEAARVARPAGTQPVGTAATLAQEAQRKLNLAAQVGSIDFATANQLDELGINWKEAMLAGTSKVIPGALAAGAAAGAAGLIAGPAAPVTVPIAAAAGAAVGAIGNFYLGVTGNIKAQKGDLISGKTTELKKRQTALNNYISATNTNPAAADDYVQAFNTELSLIRKDYNSLNKEANEDLTLFGGQDGTPQLIAYEVFFESVEPSMIARMDLAVRKPDPTRAYLSAENLE